MRRTGDWLDQAEGDLKAADLRDTGNCLELLRFTAIRGEVLEGDT
jgi:hypothetical protein